MGSPRTIPPAPDEGKLKIPPDLQQLYRQAMSGEAAVCYWREHGPYNSRWINPGESDMRNKSLVELIRRLARAEAR